MNDLVVDFASLRSLVCEIDNHLERIGQLLDDLQSKVDALTTQWTGAASEDFRRAHADWSAATTDLRIQLAGICDLVRTAHDNHATAVRTNTTLWRV